MSIDTLLEAARYLEWEAQQHAAPEEDQLEQRELFAREAELRRSEVTVSAQTGGVHPRPVAWGNEPLHLQTHHVPVVAPPPPPPPSLRAPLVPPVLLPVLTPAPSPLRPAVAAAASIAVATPMLNGSSPSHHLQLQQLPLPPPLASASPRPLLSSPTIKLEPAPQQNGAVPPQLPQLQSPYQAAFSPPSGAASPLMPPHSPESRTNGLLDDMRGADGKRRPGGAGTREVHNKLEKNRRAHLKECFETLKKNVPNVDEKKTSNLSVLRGALRYIQTLKRKDKEYEHEVERLTREKIASQQRLAQLKKELGPSMDATEMERVLRQTVQPEDDQVSTSTASEGEEDLDQDFEDEDMPAPLPSEPPPIAPPPILQAHALLTLQPAPLPLSGVLTTPQMGGVPVQSQAPPPQAIAPHPPQPSAAQAQPSVIAHAAVSHPSVIQAVHHKHLTPIAPSPGPAAAAPQPAAAAAAQRVTVTHLGPALYPQALTVSQHIAHTFTHHHPHHHALAPAHATPNGLHVNGGQTAVLAPHPQLGGQTTLLNPVTLVKLT
ncbi:max-binding protein MNT-like [Gadus macrocephalus]|uniref:max-binding protein MNT-like n=1 Tax=Gadus macrocephalus TaxID=80720 RepID=UPI0028CB1EB8|nr:max-binding protein MNT-like [Gadus macrocephalus]